MAQTKRKRRRKHRGTQSGSVDRRRRRPRSRQEARAQARRQAAQRRDRPPTWQSAINRALIGGVIFFALITLAFGQTVGQAITLTAFMVLIYIPMGYYMEKFFYSRRLAAEAKRRAREQQAQQRRR
jgi:drug/metabolite transporter (DMT)-like permease